METPLDVYAPKNWKIEGMSNFNGTFSMRFSNGQNGCTVPIYLNLATLEQDYSYEDTTGASDLVLPVWNALLFREKVRQNKGNTKMETPLDGRKKHPPIAQ